MVLEIIVAYQPQGVDRTLLEREAGVKTVGTGGGGDTASLGTPLNLTAEEQAAQVAKWRELGKVSRGGTPSNETWRSAA